LRPKSEREKGGETDTTPRNIESRKRGNTRVRPLAKMTTRKGERTVKWQKAPRCNVAMLVREHRHGRSTFHNLVWMGRGARASEPFANTIE